MQPVRRRPLSQTRFSYGARRGVVSVAAALAWRGGILNINHFHGPAWPVPGYAWPELLGSLVTARLIPASPSHVPLGFFRALARSLLVFSAEIRTEYNAGEDGRLASTKNVKRMLNLLWQRGQNRPTKIAICRAQKTANGEQQENNRASCPDKRPHNFATVTSPA